MSEKTLDQLMGEVQTHHVTQALKPLVRTAGIRQVECQIGQPARFFENIRQRGTLRLRDFLATCSAIDHDPVAVLSAALKGELASKAKAKRRPRIISIAWKQLEADGEGIGPKRLGELESAIQTVPRKTRAILRREISQASREEVPSVLGFYGSALRVEADLFHAEIVLREAQQMARELDLPAVGADLLVRLAYVTLESQRPSQALIQAKDSVVVSVGLGDKEGQGKALLCCAMLCYHSGEYREALRDDAAVLTLSTVPEIRFSAFSINAHCWIALNQRDRVEAELTCAEELASSVPPWLMAKLEWFRARLVDGEARLERLKAAQKVFSKHRPADCMLVTAELVEEYLSSGHLDQAAKEVSQLCNLLERTDEHRPVRQAVARLARNYAKLTPSLVAQLRRALDQARGRRLSAYVGD